MKEKYYKVKCVGTRNYIKLVHAQNYTKFCSFKEAGFPCQGEIIKVSPEVIAKEIKQNDAKRRG